MVLGVALQAASTGVPMFIGARYTGSSNMTSSLLHMLTLVSWIWLELLSKFRPASLDRTRLSHTGESCDALP